MTIGIFDPYLDALGGGERYMLSIASCLSSKHNVSIFWDDAAIITQAEDRFGIHLKHISVVKNIFSPSTTTIHRLKESKKYDAIFYLSDGSIPFVLSKKLVLHFQFPVPWVEGKTFQTKIKLKKVHAVICNSKFTQLYIDKTFGIKSTVIYPPAIDRNSINGEKRKENIIISVGRIAGDAEGNLFKKQDILIKVFQKMCDEGLSGWQLIIAGGVTEQNTKEIIKLQTVAGNYPIKLYPNISYNALQELYAKSKIYWHAAGYKEDVGKHPEKAEHFGITTVEAMHAGVIPIVFKAGGQEEIIIDNKNGFLWETEGELIEKTQLIINSNVLREKVLQEAIIRSTDFSEERFCSEFQKILT